MSTTLGSLILELDLDDGKFKTQLDNARKNALSAAGNIEKDLKRLNLDDAINTKPKLDDSRINPSLKKLELNAKQTGQKLNREFGNLDFDDQLHLAPTVDHSELYELNAHLDEKLKHFRQINDVFALNPLKVRSDTREVDGATKKLEQATQKEFKFNIHSDGTDKIRQELSLGLGADINELDRTVNNLQDQNQGLISSNENLMMSIRQLSSSVDRNVESNDKMPVKMSRIIHASGKESLLDKVMGVPGRIFDMLTTGAIEGFGAQLSYDFARGTQKYVEAKTGFDSETLGYNFGRYGYNRTKGFAMIGAEAMGYRGGLKEVGDDLAYLGRKLDDWLTPSKFVKKINSLEDLLVGTLEDVQVYNDEGAARGRIKDYFQPTMDSLQESGTRAAGVGLRAAAQPFRIRKRVQLAQSMEIAKKYAETIDVPEIENIDDIETIALTTGGISLEEGAPNTFFARNMMKGVLGPGVATVPVPNVFGNDKNEMGQFFELRKQILQGIIENLRKSPEMRKRFGLDRDGLKVEDLENPMQFDKMLQIAVESGYNPDAIAMESVRRAYEQKYPGKKYIFAGTSAGTVAAEEATAMAERGGATNVKGFGATLGLTGLTQTASTKNFRSFVGDLDPLFAAMFGRESLESLTPEQKDLMWTKMKEAENMPFPAEIMQFLNENLKGLLAPSKNTEIIESTGVGHNLAQFMSDPAFQESLLSFLGNYIQGIPEDATGKRGSSPFKASVPEMMKVYNQMYASPRGMHYEDLQRTIGALEGDEKALKQIEAGEYSFYNPTTGKLTQGGPDKPDISYAAEEARTKFKIKENKVSQTVLDDLENFRKAFKYIRDAVDEAGNIDVEKVKQAKEAFQKAYGSAPIIPDSVAMHPDQLEGYRMLSKNMGTTVHGNEDIPILDAKAVGAGAAGAIFTDSERQKAWKTSKVPMYDKWRQFLGLANTVGREAKIQETLPSDLAGEVYEKGEHYSVQELLKGMDVGKLVQAAKEKNDPQEIIKYIAHMGKLLRRLHEHKVTHGDFHFGNVFSVDTLEGEALKAIDFGYSKKDANKKDIREDYKKALAKIKGKKEMGVQQPGVVEKMELPIEVDDALEAFKKGYRGEEIEPLTRPSIPPKKSKAEVDTSLASVSGISIGDVELRKRKALREHLELQKKEQELNIPNEEEVQLEIVGMGEAAQEAAESFIEKVKPLLIAAAEGAGEALANQTEKGIVGLINRLMTRVPGDPNSIDANPPTIERLSDIGPEQIQKASALGIEDAASMLGKIGRGANATAKATGAVIGGATNLLRGAQPAATSFIESSRERMSAIRGTIADVKGSLSAGTTGPDTQGTLRYLMGDGEDQGYIDRLIADVDNAIAQLQPAERMRPLEGIQLANVKSQGVKARKSVEELQQILNNIENQYNEFLQYMEDNAEVIEGEIIDVSSEVADPLNLPGQQQVRQLTAAQPPPNYERMVKRTSDDFVQLKRIVENKKGQYSQEQQQAAATEITKTADEAYKAITDLQQSLGDRATTPLKNLSSAAKGQISRAKKAVEKSGIDVSSIPEQTANLGRNVADGFPQGFGDRISALKAESLRLVEGGIIDPMAKGLKIQSPSKLTEYYGQMVGEGFVKGITSKVGSAGKAIKDLYKMADLYQSILRESFDSSVIKDEFSIIGNSITEILTQMAQLQNASEAIGEAKSAVGRIANFPNEAIISKYKENVRANAQRVKNEPVKAHKLPEGTKKAIFAASGFSGTQGEVAKEIASKVQAMSPKGTHVIPFGNPNFDVSGTLDEVGIGRVVIDAIMKPMEMVKQGFNTEALRLAKEAYAVKQSNPGVEVGFVGHSAGGFIVREAQEILKAMEIFSQALTLATPLLGAFEAIKPNTVSLMGERDQIRWAAGQKEGIIPGVGGHFSPEYLNNSNEIREILTKYLEDGITPSLIQRIHDLGSAIQGIEPGNSGPLMRFERQRSGNARRRSLPGGSNNVIDVGDNIGKGLAVGIDGGAKHAIEAANHMADSVIDITESAFEISSPSKWADRIGGYIGQGLVNGLNKTKSKVSNAVIGIKESAKQTFSTWVDSPNEDDFVPIEWNTKRPEADIPVIGPAYAMVLDSMESMKNMATALPEIGRGLAGVFEGVMQNTPAIMNMAKGFVVFNFIVKPLITTLAAFEEASFNVAVEMQNMTNVIELVSGSAAEGAKNIAFIREQVQALGGDMRASMEGFSQLGASAQGTRLEGEGTRQIFSAVSQAATVYQMDPEQQGRAYTALSQMMDKSVVSAEELRGQLAESLPGAIAIAARAMGVSTQELGKMMEMGEVMAEDLLPRFAQQLSAETAGGLAGSARTAQSSINKLNNEILLLQESYGNTTIPIRIAGMEAASTGIKLVRENILALSTALSAMIVALLKQSITELAKFLGKFAKIKAVTELVKTAFSNLIKTLIPMIKKLGVAFLKQFAFMTAVGDTLTIIGKAFGDASGGMSETAKSTTDAWESYLNVLDEAKKKQEELEKSKPQGASFDRFEKSGGIESLRSFAQNAGPLGYLRDAGSAFRNLDGSTEAYGELGKTLIGGQQVIDVSKDAKKFFSAFVDGIGISDDLKQLMKDESLVESTLVGSIFGKELSRVFENGMHQVLGSIQGATGLVGSALNAIPGMGMLRGLGGLGLDLGRTYGDMQREQRDIAVSEQVMSGGNIEQEARRTLFNATGDPTGDLKRIIELDEQYRKAQQRRSALPREDVQGQRKLEEEINNILNERGTIYTNVGKQQANLQLSVENYKTQIKAIQEEIATLGNSDQDNERRKQLEGQLAVLESNMKGSQNILDRINAKLGEAANRVELLARQFRLINAELQNANYNLELQTVQQQKLVADRIGPGRDGLRQGTSNVLQQQQAAQKIAANQNFIQQTEGILNDTAYLEALENAGLKATSTAADIAAKIEELSDSSLKDTLTTIQSTKEQLEQTTLETAQLEAQIADLRDQLEEQLHQMTREMNNMMRELGNQVELLEEDFKAAANDRKIKSAAGDISRSMKLLRTDHFSGFMGLLEEFVNVLGEQLQSTADFIKQKIELTQNLFNQLRENDAFNRGIPQIDGGITGAGVVSPLKGKSIEELVNYNPAQAQSFLAPRNRRGRRETHGGVDFDSRVGGGGGAMTSAPLSGSAQVIDIGEQRGDNGNAVQVRINTQGASGEAIELRLNHLELNSVREALGVGIGGTTQVSAGQDLGEVIQHHLDFKVKINGEFVDPQQWLSAMNSGGGTARTIGGGSVNITAPSPQSTTSSSSRPTPSGLTVKGQQATDAQFQYARVITRVGQEIGATPDEIRVAIATAIQESTLRNLGGGDRDSAGLFQQRPSMDWGSWSQVTNPEQAARSFFQGIGTNIGLIDTRGRSNDLYQRSHLVQRSAHPDAPRRWDAEAAQLTQAAIAANSSSSTSPMSAREGNQVAAAPPQPVIPQVDISGITTQSNNLIQQSSEYRTGLQDLYNQQLAELNRQQDFMNQQFGLNLQNIASRAQQEEITGNRRVEDSRLETQRREADRSFNATPDFQRTPEMVRDQDITVATRSLEDERTQLDRQISDLEFDISEVQNRIQNVYPMMRQMGAPDEYVSQMEQSGQAVITSAREQINILQQQRENISGFLDDTTSKITAEYQRALENTQFQNASDITEATAALMEAQADRAEQTGDPQEAARLRNAAQQAREIDATNSAIRNLQQSMESDPINAGQYQEQIDLLTEKNTVALETLNETLRRTSEEIAQYNKNLAANSSREVRALEIQKLRFDGDPVQALLMEQEDALAAQLQEFEERRLEIEADLQLDSGTRQQLLDDLAEIEAMTIEMTAKLDVRAQVQLALDNESALLDARATNLEALIPNLNATYQQGAGRDMQYELDGLRLELDLRQQIQNIEDPDNGLTAETRERLKLLAEETAELQAQNLERDYAIQVERDRNEIARNTITNPGGPQALAQVQDEYLGMYDIAPTWQMRQERLPMQLELQQIDYQDQLLDLEELRNSGKLTQEAFEKAKESLAAMNDIKLDKIRQEASGVPEVVKAVKGPFQGLFSDLLSGSKTAGEAFNDFVNSILSNLANLMASQLTDGLFGSFLGGGAGSPGQEGGLFDGLFGPPDEGIIEGGDPGTTLVTGANQASQLVAQSGQVFLQYAQQAGMALQQSTFGLNGGGPLEFGTQAFSFLGGGGSRAATAANRGFSVDTSSLNLSFDRGSRSLADAITSSSNKGSSLFSNAIGGISSALSGRNPLGATAGGGLFGGSGGGGGLLGSLFSIGLSFLGGFKDGGQVGIDGYIPNFASGGKLNAATDPLGGIGAALRREGPRGRVIVASDGEWILNNRQVAMAKKMGLTEDIFNYKTGGVVGNVSTPTFNSSNIGGSTTVNVPVTVTSEGGSSEEDAKQAGELAKKVKSAVYDVINKERRFGGLLN